MHPAEIEAVLAEQPGVGEAIVFGVPDPAAGQKIIAIVESTPGGSAVEPKVLVQRCREQLSAFKVPQDCRVIARLPRTRSGKPDRPALAANYIQDQL